MRGRVRFFCASLAAMVVLGAVAACSPTASTPPVDAPAAVARDTASTTPTPAVPAPYPEPGSVGAVEDGTLDVIEPPGGVLVVEQEVFELRDTKVLGGIDFTGAELRLRNVVVEGGHGYWGLVVVRGRDAVVDVADSTIRSVTPLEKADGILPLDGGAVIARRVDISGGADGIKVGSRAIVEDSWIHDLATVGGAHNDGIQVMGGDGVEIRRNRIEVNEPDAFDGVHQNAAIFVQPFGEGATVDDVVIEDNFLMGGGFTLRLEGGATGVSVVDNVFGPPATTVDWAGDYLVEEGVSVADWAGNVRGDVDGDPAEPLEAVELGDDVQDGEG